MELDNVDVLLGMTIASIIIGIGLSMFFISHYNDGAVVLAIGMMTLALMITARPRVIERVKREIVLQPSKQADSQTKEAAPHQEVKSEENQTVQSTQPQPEADAKKQEEELITATPS